MNGDRAFLDTNIIIYAYDVSAGDKHDKAGEIVRELWNSGLGLISTQVLQEFYVIMTQKVPRPLEKNRAKEIVSDFLKWDVVVNTGDSILDAVDIQLKHNFSFWDSLIIVSAVRGGAASLYSEDLSHGQIIDGLTIQNPFR